LVAEVTIALGCQVGQEVSEEAQGDTRRRHWKDAMVGEVVVTVIDCEQNVLVEGVAGVEAADTTVTVADSSQAVREDLIGGVGRMSEALSVMEGVVVGVLLHLQAAVVEQVYLH
jgi:hypothetical protein